MVISREDHLRRSRTEAEKQQNRVKMKSDRGQLKVEDGEEENKHPRRFMERERTDASGV